MADHGHLAAAAQLAQQWRPVLRRRSARQLLGHSEHIGAPTTPGFAGAGGASANPDVVWPLVRDLTPLREADGPAARSGGSS
ncbi:hypothetical protein ABT369_02550 [Dactylosporangium sp. NPDC000244]|uniref:hypothetical protein n=1 Tax=Dactylosporangium sp. NPDC000244 TaxID=3154365 RepID=UPI0033340456